MDTDSVKLVEQVRQYYESLAAYEQARQEMHLQQSRALALSDKKVQELLKRMGADVPSLLEETAANQRKLKEAHKVYLGFPRPPVLPGTFENPPDPNVIDIVPPAGEGFSTNCPAIDSGFNLALGEIDFEVSDQGDGWGWEATAGSPCYYTLTFLTAPPRAGDIQVDVYVDSKGQYAISANDHWYTSTSADLTLSVSSRLYQHYWEYGPTITLIDEHLTDSSESGWVDRYDKLSYTTSISAHDTIFIFIEVKLDYGAQSSDARVDVDFKTGAERRIRVPVIRLRYL